MAWADVLPVIGKLAPMIATGLGGPLAGGAVAALEACFGITSDSSKSMDDRQSTIAAAIAGATPEQLAAMQKANLDYQARMTEAGFANEQALAKLKQEETLAYVSDTADARAKNAANDRVFLLGVVILLTFGVIMGAALWASYALLTGTIALHDASVVGLVAGFVGTIIGYVAANAQQVVSFFFGSSRGSETKTDAMASAFTAQFGKTADKPAK